MKLGVSLAALALATVASAQGSAGGDQSVCRSSQAFQYQGCFGNTINGNHAGFKYQVNVITTDPKYYPNYNNTVLTIEMCLTACRGHGFRYAALYSKSNCYCGTIAPTSQTTLSNPADNTTINECHVLPALTNGCPGNRNEWCGSGTAADVYGDPSFPSVALTSQETSYNYLGCFQNQSPGDLYTDGSSSITVANTAACWQRCADSGYPYAGMTSATSCLCGTDFEVGLQAASESACNTACTAGE